jgi:polysaccharide biosynthesis/export protein
LVLRNILLVLSMVSVLASCGFPAGAPVESQILAAADDENPEFTVVEVSRANLARVSNWPATGWRGHYTWLQAGGGGSVNVIRPGDLVDLVIWDNQDNSLLTTPNSKSTSMREIAVSPSGTVFVPYVGDIVINGLTPDDARREVQKEVERIAPSAQVQLNVIAGQNNTVDLVRGVARPGIVSLPSRNFTILSLLAQGGGIAGNLENPLVRLIRAGKTYEIRAEDLMSDARRNIVMRGGDKVIIEDDDRYFVAAGATGNKLVSFDKERITAMEALSMAGGLRENRADPKGILILRDYPQSAVRADGIKGPEMAQVVFTVDLTSADSLFAAREFAVQPGDLVMVTESQMVGVNSLLALVSQALLARSRL